jgi:hypothetical protein
MEFEFGNGILKFEKILSDLDKFVLDFVDLLEKNKIRYVIVSGYVSIVLGRTRTTEDVDIFISKINFDKFQSFFNILQQKNYWILNAVDVKEPFNMLEDGLAIRIAKKNTVIPNFEIKFAKKDTDFISLEKPLKVIVNRREVLMSPLEIQIPFKFWLGSNKDIEDAIHIFTLFEQNLDKQLLEEMAKRLKVKKEMNKYGIG